MEKITGTNNRILEVHLGTGQSRIFSVSPKDRRQYLGGKGLGLKLLYRRLKPGVDPLGPDNWLAFMPGVLMGTGGPCTGRFAAVTKSPLTGIMLSSSCGGPFGMALKTAGYDGLLITGAAPAPVALRIDKAGVRFEDAGSLWGLDTVESQKKLKLSRADGAMVIGPAGENQVRFANVATGHRFLGRGGMGAVMGAKQLKAVVASGKAFKIVPADPKGFKATAEKATAWINANDFTARRYRNYGTSANVALCNEGGLLPVNNFQAGSSPNAQALFGKALKKRYKTKYSTCKPCTILCGHKGTFPDGKEHQLPEYETLGLLGTNLGIFDPDLIGAWNDRCSQLGMDTISAGGVLAWVMEAGEKNIIKTDLRFGSKQGITRALEEMALCRGFGSEMARGTRYLADKYGGKDFAMQVKGLEMAAYDPRGAFGQGLAYAVANRGGCHLSAYMVSLEKYFGLLNPYKTGAKAEFTKFFEDITCCINALQTCQFTMFAYTMESPLTKYTPNFILGLAMQYLPTLAVGLVDFSLYTRLWQNATGIAISNREFLKAGTRIHILERYMNTREGISKKDDTLPQRLLCDHRKEDSRHYKVPLNKMLKRYYRLRGYSAEGLPTEFTLKKLDILPLS